MQPDCGHAAQHTCDQTALRKRHYGSGTAGDAEGSTVAPTAGVGCVERTPACSSVGV